MGLLAKVIEAAIHNRQSPREQLLVRTTEPCCARGAGLACHRRGAGQHRRAQGQCLPANGLYVLLHPKDGVPGALQDGASTLQRLTPY